MSRALLIDTAVLRHVLSVNAGTTEFSVVSKSAKVVDAETIVRFTLHHGEIDCCAKSPAIVVKPVRGVTAS